MQKSIRQLADQNCKSKVKSSFALLFNFIYQLADKIIPIAVIPELNSGQALTKVRI